MRPLELTLEGFTSFRSRANINFEKFDLFAITGQTGAGKSSILDAMTLSLFGKVPRLSGKSQHKELLSQGSLKLQVSLRFLVDKVEYQVLRSWSYRTKTPQPIYKLEKRVGDNWQPFGEQKEPEINALIEKIVGMDFETFTKVILLPQGQFDKFLKGEASKRREILRKLAGYEIFADMRLSAEKQNSILEGECKSIQADFDSLELLSDAEITAKTARFQTLELELPRYQEALTNAQLALAAEKQLFDKIQKLNAWQQQLKQLNQQATNISNLTQQLETARVCDRLSATWTLVESIRNRHQKAQQDAENAAKKLTQAKTDFKVQEENLEKAKIREAEIRPKLQQREDALKAAAIYEQTRQQDATEVKRLEQILTTKNQAVEDTKKAETNAKHDLDATTAQVTELNNDLAKYNPGGARLEQLKQAAPVLIQWEDKSSQAQEEDSKLQEITKLLEESKQAYQTAVNNFNAVEIKFDTKRLELETARQQNYAAALRVLLHTNDDCPVCGGVYPETDLLPELESSHDIKNLEKRFAVVDKEKQILSSEKTKAETNQDNLKQRKIEIEQSLTNKQNELNALTQQINEILQSDVWDVKALKAEQKTLTESDAKYQQILQNQNKAEADVDKYKLISETATGKLADASLQSQQADDEVKRQNQKLQDTLNKLFELTGNESYENLTKKLEKDKQDLQNLLDAANSSYQTARDKLTQAQQDDTNKTQELNFVTTEKQQRETDWQTNLTTESFTEELFKQGKASPELQKEWQQTIENYKRNQIELQTNIERESNEIGGKTTNAEVITQREKSVMTAAEEQKQAQQECNKLKLEIETAKQKQQQAQQLQTRLLSKQQELKTYHILSKELQSHRFQAYILQHFERDLVQHATVLLRELTDQRYVLTYDDKEYYVEDNWNGGDRRKVQTLSGGETFAVSLSLALALSEKLSRGAKLGSLFIDEGFGTLDAETLQSVSSILQSLGKQDKLVGVITHVPALGEELGTQIKVEKSQIGAKITVIGI